LLAFASGGYMAERWEYLMVTVAEGHWRDNLGREGKLDHLRRNVDFPAAMCAALGDDAWELAGIASSGHIESHILYFKRPKG
jgi:hypothetical protein